jgi:hypothetical protein
MGNRPEGLIWNIVEEEEEKEEEIRGRVWTGSVWLKTGTTGR